jgi:hypothetical protein
VKRTRSIPGTAPTARSSLPKAARSPNERPYELTFCPRGVTPEDALLREHLDLAEDAARAGSVNLPLTRFLVKGHERVPAGGSVGSGLGPVGGLPRLEPAWFGAGRWAKLAPHPHPNRPKETRKIGSPMRSAHSCP